MSYNYDGMEHDLHNPECSGCWEEYPKLCECKQGLVHAHFGDYTSEDSYFLMKSCDNCGEDFNETDVCVYCGGGGIAYKACHDMKKGEWGRFEMVSCPNPQCVVDNIDKIHKLLKEE